MSSGSLVSVVVPTYNQASYLRQAIDSVLAQDYPNIELVVVNDGSTDGTSDVIVSYGDRVVNLEQANRGAANALNRGIRAARGDYVCWLSSDDVFLPGKISRQVQALAAEPDVGLCFTGFETIDAEGRPLEDFRDIPLIHPDLFVSVFWRNPINGSTVMMPRRVFDVVGWFDETLRADVDGDMWLRVLQRYEARFLHGAMIRYRVHGQALSANRPLMVASKTAVRLRWIRDGSLSARLKAVDPAHRPAILAEISQEFTRARAYLPDAARALLVASVKAGPAVRAQWAAALAIYRAARRGPGPIRRARRAARSLVRRLAPGPVRRLLGRDKPPPAASPDQASHPDAAA